MDDIYSYSLNNTDNYMFHTNLEDSTNCNHNCNKEYSVPSHLHLFPMYS
jgi:hypothetical protein